MQHDVAQAKVRNLDLEILWRWQASMAYENNDDPQLNELRQALAMAELTVDELWLKFFAVGGSVDQLELEAFLFGAHALPALERDLMAQALNEDLEDLEDLSIHLRIRYSATMDPSGGQE